MELAIKTVDDLSRVSKMFVESGFFQDTKDAAQAGVKILAGQEKGFAPFSSMTGFHIIQGKPAMGANLIAAGIKRSGKYDYRVITLTDELCELQFFENTPKGKEAIGISTFDTKDAQKAQVKNMQKFPRNMLFARAISNGVRFYCPDVFDAPVYTPEELGANVDEEGNVLNEPLQAEVVFEERDYSDDDDGNVTSGDDAVKTAKGSNDKPWYNDFNKQKAELQKQVNEGKTPATIISEISKTYKINNKVKEEINALVPDTTSKLTSDRALAMGLELEKMGFAKLSQPALVEKVLDRQVESLAELSEAEALEIWSYAKRVAN